MSKQGVYLALTGASAVYVGSVAGGQRRTFDARSKEHRRELERGIHPNKRLQADGPKGFRLIPLVRVKQGDIEAARKIERIIIKALKGTVCNERF